MTIQQIQRNWSETSRTLGSAVLEQGSALLHTRESLPRGGGFWNFALTASCPPERAERTLVDIQSHFNSRNLPYAIYTFDGQFHSEFEKFASGSAISLSNTQTIMTFSKSHLTPPRSNVSRIDAPEVPEWVRVMGMIFERSGVLLEAMEECYAAAAREAPNAARFYVIESAGETVGTAFAYFDGNVLGIHNVGVLEKHRRRGFGRALTLTAVAEAIDEGAELVWLRTVTGEFAETLYTELGFRALSHCCAFRPRDPG